MAMISPFCWPDEFANYLDRPKRETPATVSSAKENPCASDANSEIDAKEEPPTGAPMVPECRPFDDSGSQAGTEALKR